MAFHLAMEILLRYNCKYKIFFRIKGIIQKILGPSQILVLSFTFHILMSLTSTEIKTEI